LRLRLIDLKNSAIDEINFKKNALSGLMRLPKLLFVRV